MSALDVSIQAQIVNLLEDLQHEFGLTYPFIAHDLAVVRHISDRVAVMYLGHIVEVAPADELYAGAAAPVHDRPALPRSRSPDPVVERSRDVLSTSPADIPSPANPPTGCRFHTRCPSVQPTRCVDEEPLLRSVSGHEVACHFAEDVASGRFLSRLSREPPEYHPPLVESVAPAHPPLTRSGGSP